MPLPHTIDFSNATIKALALKESKFETRPVFLVTLSDGMSIVLKAESRKPTASAAAAAASATTAYSIAHEIAGGGEGRVLDEQELGVLVRSKLHGENKSLNYLR